MSDSASAHAATSQPLAKIRGKLTKSSKAQNIRVLLLAFLLSLLFFHLWSLPLNDFLTPQKKIADFSTSSYYNSTSSASAIDTAIIITSSWIPTNPSTNMIEAVIASTRYLIGLSALTPIFVTIDTFPESAFTSKIADKITALEEYSTRLFQKYLTSPRVHILPGMKNLHIGGSVMKAMQLIELHYPSVQYLYYMQHDFPFMKEVDHAALVNIMSHHPHVNYVRFPKRNGIRRSCGNQTEIIYNRNATNNHVEFIHVLRTNATNNSIISLTSPLTLFPTSSYSDNNHFVRLAWYKETIASLIMLQRPPEFPLQVRANEMCQSNKSMGLYLYDHVVLAHLDGRNTQA